MTTSATPAISTEGLTREFRSGKSGPVTALDNVTLDVPAGQALALLGENGAGKSTLVKILSGLLLPTAGRASITGFDVVREARKARASTSVVLGGDRGLYGMLSASQNLHYFGVLAGASRRRMREITQTLLVEIGLSSTGSRPVQTFSKGQKQRLHLAIGLVTRPPVFLLDEPTVGLDPNEADRLRGVIDELRQEGTTVLLTSHNLLDVERLADRVVMIAGGRITHDLPLTQFARIVGYDAVVSMLIEGRQRFAAGSLQATAEGDHTRVIVTVEEWSDSTLDLLARIAQGRRILDMQIRPASLEDAFAMASRGEG